ncbi:hypothetical protein E2562_020063 [Oryza meyeriana var. granulata]|uniref:Uncharacterized protein n=1 Tax=Oryza meyeriana var. granulata TaxID=110450 RepID=A0A6G1BYC3_9ORYZ|nr:hypothetical protein E2562_020063 [Oryza meyeriana var. granulata]
MVRMKCKAHKAARKDVPPVKTKQAARRGTKRDLGDDHAEETKQAARCGTERDPGDDHAKEILYLDSLRIENINMSRKEYRATIWINDMINKAIQLDTLPDGNFGALPEECHLESETKEGDADDRKKGQLPDAEKAEDCPEDSKEQQEGQTLALAQSTPNQEEEAVGDYAFLVRQATPSKPKDVPTFNLGFDSTQETLEEVTITSKDYGSFTTEDYEWVGREADEAIALQPLEDFEKVRREADEASAKKASKDTTPVLYEYNKREQIEVVLNKKEVYLLNNQLDRNNIKSLFSKSDDRLSHKELDTGSQCA